MSFLKKGKLRENEKVEVMREELKNGAKFVKFSVNIPRSLHRKFKIKTLYDDKNMKDVLIDAIEKYLRGSE